MSDDTTEAVVRAIMDGPLGDSTLIADAISEGVSSALAVAGLGEAIRNAVFDAMPYPSLILDAVHDGVKEAHKR